MARTPFAQLADEIRARAECLRGAADREEKRARDNRDLAAVLDAVAIKVADGEIPVMSDALDAARPREMLWFPGVKKEPEVDRLRRTFGIQVEPV